MLTSTHLLPGEQANLLVRVVNGQPDRRPPTPEIEGAAVNYVRTRTEVSNGRLGYAFLYRLTPAKPGSYTVPEIRVPSQGQILRSAPIPFTVYPKDRLVSLPTGIRGLPVRAAWFPAKTTLYQGEQCRVLLKLYVPRNLSIVNWGYPDSAKKNCLAWRFSPPAEHGYSQVSLDQTTHNVVTYSTTLSGISPGKAVLGPSTLKVFLRRPTIDPMRGTVTRDVPLELTLPPVEFDILALPDGAPADFQGAVGHFQIDARCEKTTLNAAEPTEVILRVAGTGNLPTLKAPVLTGNGWKVIDTSKVTRGEERRQLSGMVTFRQLIRPDTGADSTPPVSQIPPYSFSYFNPDTRRYHTLTTDAIPVTITGAAKTPQPMPEPADAAPEEMRHIIGFIKHPDVKTSAAADLASRYWHLLPAALCLLVVAPAVRRKVAAARTKHPDAARQESALRKIGADSDTRTFYRRAGRYIEQWLAPTPELEAVIEERDRVCYLPETAPQPPLAAGRKAEIIRLLKKSTKSLLILFAAVLILPDARAGEGPQPQAAPQPPHSSTAEEAWQAGHYRQALALYQATYPVPSDTPADVLFNIGNCHHRLGEKGRAALAWRRALLADPTHRKSRQNLRFVELETNASVPDHRPWQRLLARFPPGTYRFIIQACLWIFGIALLTIVVRRPRGMALTGCIVLLAVTPVIAALGMIAAHNYPDAHLLAPPRQQAVVLGPAQLHDQAHRTSASTPLPEASLVKANATRGPWTHVTTTDGSTGWVQSKRLGKVAP